MEMSNCSNPGCALPGINQCSACKTTPYCGPICQTAHWIHHKEECPGHLLKVGMSNLVKAKGFDRANNWLKSLHHAILAATKLKQLQERRVEDIDKALQMKYQALACLGRYKESLECAKEWYCMYPTNHTHPPAIRASFAVIESCGFNKEYFDAALYARTLWETITMSRDSHIPDSQREDFTARGAFELARALWQLAEHGGMPPEEKQKAGEEATMLARRALEINTQLRGTESEPVASSMCGLASVLDYFNDVENDEVPRLFEHSKKIFEKAHGSLSANVASCSVNLGNTFKRKASRAEAAQEVDRCVASLEISLLHYREAARIYRAINQVDRADELARQIVVVEKSLRQIVAKRTTVSRA